MRGALQPLARLDRAAGEIGRTGDPSRRLPDPHGADEVGRLATTLNAMLESLERAQESERRFLADASHELRTPLTALRGNVAHLARHGATPALVADLEADAERLARLADDLLTLSREEAASPPSDDVRLDKLARAAGADRVDAESVTVPGDRAALERSLSKPRRECAATTVVVRSRSPSARTATGRCSASRTKGRACLCSTGSACSSASTAMVRGSAWRSSAPPRSATGAVRTWTVPASDRARQESFRVRQAP